MAQENDLNTLAKRQVDAFMSHLMERLSVDEEKMQTIIRNTTKNGKVYVTWAAILSIVMAVAGWLIIDKIQKSDVQISKVIEKQADVRERLTTFEYRINRNDKDEAELRERLKHMEKRLDAIDKDHARYDRSMTRGRTY